MRLLLSAAALIALAACNGSSAREAAGGEPRANPGDAAGTRGFALDGFDKVELRGPDNVEVRVGGAFAVEAEGNADALARLEIAVVDGVLRIGREDDAWLSWGDDDSQGVRVRVSMPSIRAASVAGSGDMTVDRAAAESFEGAVAGSGNLAIAAIEATRVALDIAGSGDITAAGSVRGVEIGIAGSGSIDARELRAETLDASIAGSGNVAAFATRSAEASILGSGDVTVRGGARCTSNAMGSGELRCEG